jgi:hypothetical protein
MTKRLQLSPRSAVTANSDAEFAEIMDQSLLRFSRGNQVLCEIFIFCKSWCRPVLMKGEECKTVNSKHRGAVKSKK